MAIADMFLKVQGVSGESADADHKGEIDVVSWSWGMNAAVSIATGSATGRGTMTELEIVKRVDQSSPVLMLYLRNHKVVPTVKLTIRKAGKQPLEYFTIELTKALITSLRVESQNVDLSERINFAFERVRVTYTLQDAKGGAGAATMFETDALVS